MWMQTRSGRRFHFDTLGECESQVVDPHDVVWSLAHQCRFNGHCRRFYSVAEHTVRMLETPMRLGLWFTLAESRRLVGMILTHDAHEAYMGDITRPLKSHFGEEFHAFERRIQDFVQHVVARRDHAGRQDAHHQADRQYDVERNRIYAQWNDNSGQNKNILRPVIDSCNLDMRTNPASQRYGPRDRR